MHDHENKAHEVLIDRNIATNVLSFIVRSCVGLVCRAFAIVGGTVTMWRTLVRVLSVIHIKRNYVIVPTTTPVTVDSQGDQIRVHN